MLRKIAGAVVILGLAFGIANAETLKGKIVKIEGKTLTFKAGKAEAKTYDIAPNVKVSKKKGDATEPVSGGLDSLKVGDKGMAAIIEVDGNKVTEITIGGGKKKKNQ